MRLLIGCLLLVLLSACQSTKVVVVENIKEVGIIPQPNKISLKNGSFRTKPQMSVYLKGVDEIDQLRLLNAAGDTLKSLVAISESDQSDVVIEITQKLGNLSLEGYRLDVTAQGIRIQAKSAAGVFYGLKSLVQLAPVEVNDADADLYVYSIPCVSIEDSPRFGWRGMHLDVSRHFFTVDEVKRYLDCMARYKLNLFHWHLTDDQGWRIEIKRYPKLTKKGAWRAERPSTKWHDCKPQQAGEACNYGGFYTQQQIRDIVAYAADRYITILPEIEFPGHSRAAIASYPHLSCAGKQIFVATGGEYGIQGTSALCAGKETTFEFMKNVLTEISQLFPSKYIHIGGDECNKSEWKKCRSCQARITKYKLQNEEELQSYLIKRLEKMLAKQGKELLGWDEILEGGLAPNATVMSWRGFGGGVKAAKAGHRVVMTPGSHTYFDHLQGAAELEPHGEFLLPISRVYQFDPVPTGLTPSQQKMILGGEACMWTEHVSSEKHLQYMTLPRMLALAEAVWTDRSNKSWPAFAKRLCTEVKVMDLQQINYARSAWHVQVKAVKTASGEYSLSLYNEVGEGVIRYTLDGRVPTSFSPVYKTPLKLNRSLELSAAVFQKGKIYTPVTHKSFRFHKACGAKVVLKNLPSKKYPGAGDIGLNDTIRGTLVCGDGVWSGFYKNDFSATINLKKSMPVSSITLGCLQNLKSWIFLPSSVSYYTSEDGINFHHAATVINDPADQKHGAVVKDLACRFPVRQATFVKVVAKRATCPPSHNGAGLKAWIFVDEIAVD